MSSSKLPIVRSDAATQRAVLETVARVREMKPLQRMPGMDPVFEGGGGKPAAVGFWAIINSATRDGANYRWLYYARAVKIVSNGAPYLWGSHSVVGAEHNGVLEAYAFNVREMFNGASGAMGTGIDTFNVPPTMTPVTPVPLNQLVWVHTANEWTDSGQPTQAWFFTYENSVSGGCT